ncbi:non-hydrolyzing UDP-N-acetylglucosamine 2-epimerase [Chloroflexota bacterium]
MKSNPIFLVAGARPNFVKLAPLVRALETAGELPYRVIHTGQHYDNALSASFFSMLDIPAADINLEVGSGSHAAQTARIIELFEHTLLKERPRAIVVFGDVNSTLACAVTASKLLVPVVHVEAGLRSFDRRMPEEINRIVTDVLSDLLLVSDPAGLTNLEAEGIPPSKVKYVGNIMIDSLARMLPEAVKSQAHKQLGLKAGEYAFLTMHRPSNVDSPEVLRRLMDLFVNISQQLPIVFPVHPRTRQRLQALGFQEKEHAPNLLLIPPADYLESLCLQKFARVVLSDSGGIQEESSYLGVPCLTMRENTERPVTVEYGSSTLVGSQPEQIQAVLDQVLSGHYKQGRPIPLWDGHTAERITKILLDWYA